MEDLPRVKSLAEIAGLISLKEVGSIPAPATNLVN